MVFVKWPVLLKYVRLYSYSLKTPLVHGWNRTVIRLVNTRLSHHMLLGEIHSPLSTQRTAMYVCKYKSDTVATCHQLHDKWNFPHRWTFYGSQNTSCTCNRRSNLSSIKTWFGNTLFDVKENFSIPFWFYQKKFGILNCQCFENSN